MKLWLLMALMDLFLFCAYWVVFIKAGVQRAFLSAGVVKRSFRQRVIHPHDATSAKGK